MNQTTENLYLSVNQVATRFGVAKDTIWRWRRDGDFPAPFKLGGNTTRWRLSDLKEWEDQRICCFAISLNFAPDSALFS